MDLSYEEEVPILFSPLTPNHYEDDSDDQPGEYFEEDSQETENNDFDSTSSFNESPLVEENYENVSSASSWESSPLVCQSELEDGECPSTPPGPKNK